MISLLKKLFSGPGTPDSQGAAPAVPVAGREATAPEAGGKAPAASLSRAASASVEEGIEGFVLYVARSLAENPDGVQVTTEEKDRVTVITLRCDKRDVGKIIGKNGKTIAAIRALANGAAGRLGKRVNVDVQD